MKRRDLSKGLPPDDGSPPGGKASRPRPAKDFDGATEPDLIDASLKRDIEAFTILFERHRPALYALCLRRLNDPSLAEDVVQDVFIRAFKNLPSFDRTRPFWPWLATIAVRMCVDLQRHRSLTHYSEDIAVSADEEGNGHTESALDQTIASEERAQLQSWLSTLPKRQRRVLLLHVLDGWSYEEIAAAEGISIGAVRVLLFRARRKMQIRVRRQPLPAIVLPFNWLRWKLHRMEERIRPLLGVHGEGLVNACIQAICLGTLAMMAVGASPLANSSEPDDPVRSAETPSLPITSWAQSGSLQTALLPTILPNTGGPTKTPDVSNSDQNVISSAENLVGYATAPTPEQTIIYSLVVSQDYQEDHTILASGQGIWGRKAVLLSQDGGATWKSLPSLLLRGSVVLPAPGFPRDPRLYAVSEELLIQESEDGGVTFKPANLYGSVLAIPPSFHRDEGLTGGNSKVWIGWNTLREYDADTKLTQPSPLPLPWARGLYTSITFSPTYESDGLVLVSDSGTDSHHIHYRCDGAVCREMGLSSYDELKFILSPEFGRDGLAYATAYAAGHRRLLVTTDGFGTFRQVNLDLDGGWINDVAVWWKAPSSPTLFVASQKRVYRSYDQGTSWSSSAINLPNFRFGASLLGVTPTGRLLAAGSGIACSDDLGETWAPRCPPE